MIRSLFGSSAVVFVAAMSAAGPPADGYSSCTQAAQDGRSNISQGDPGYNSNLDRDGDGVACESGS